MIDIFGCFTFLVLLSLHEISCEPPRCRCMPIKDCEPDLLTAQMLYASLQNTGCSFPSHTTAGLICCTPRHTKRRSVPNTFLSRLRDDDDDDDERWVWDYKPLPTTPATATRSRELKNNDFKLNNNFNTFKIFEFKDAKTMRNCPPIFYEDHLFDDTPFIPHVQHNHHYHQNTFDSDEDVTNSENRPFVYPDDERLHRPIIFPHDLLTTTTTATTTKTTKTTTLSNRIAFLTTTPQPKRNQQQTTVNATQCGILKNANKFKDQNQRFPWIARIGYLNKTSNRISYRCSGTLISPTFILTAAHCVVNLVPELDVSYVRMDNVNATKIQIYEIIDIIVHPSFDQPRFANDIALLKIMKPSESVPITTICLPVDDSVKLRDALSDALIGQIGVVAVWSANMNGVEIETGNATVKYLRLAIVNTTQCAIKYASLTENGPIIIGPKQLCAKGNDEQNDVCRGDSGGPFMDDGSSGLIKSNRWTLFGIVAFGPVPCGISNFPGVYTRVSSYIAWIRDTIDRDRQ